MTVIIDQKESVLGSVHIVFAILLLCSLMILGLFSHSVYRPLKKITAEPTNMQQEIWIITFLSQPMMKWATWPIP